MTRSDTTSPSDQLTSMTIDTPPVSDSSPQRTSSLWRELRGGVFSAILSLPLATAFGVVAYAPLGEEYVGIGVLAGLYGAMLGGFCTSVFGGTPGQISVPTPPLAVMVTSVIAHLHQSPALIGNGENAGLVLSLLVAMTLLMAGIFEIVQGLLGSGRLIKFIPYPVIVGLVNGAALSICLSQLRPFIGLPLNTSLLEALSGTFAPRYELLLVGLVTLVYMLVADRRGQGSISPLIGLLAGVTAYFALGFWHDHSLLRLDGNPYVIGRIPAALSIETGLANWREFSRYLTYSQISQLFIPALALSIVASTGSLLSSVMTESRTRRKHDSVRELLGQGVGNVASAVIGGLPVSGFSPVTRANLDAGGRGRWSGVFSSLTVLAVLLIFRPFMQWIPLAVLAGALLVTAGKMVDYQSLHISTRRSTIQNLLVILSVMCVTVAVDLIAAVLIGLAITTVLFIHEQIGRSIIRREYSADRVHSKKVRHQQATRVLEEKGDRIRVYELSGSLFFGTVDKLMAEIEPHLDVLCVILDLRRVNTIDLTGCHILQQIVQRAHETETHLLISYLDIPGNRDKERMRQLLEDTGTLRAIGNEHVFPDTDRALEWAEDLLIDQEVGSAESEQILDPHSLETFRDLDPEQLRTVQTYLEPREYRQGEVIFREGDPGDRMYFIQSGSVSVLASLAENGRTRRLATLGEGVFFGDMAILEQRPRSATVRADTHTRLLCMSVDDFNHLVQTEPLLISRMLLGMTRELSYRLRLTSTEVTTLAE